MALSTRSRHWLNELTLELARGHVDERRLVHAKGKEIIDGLLEGQTVTINPIPSTINTLVHELFHRRYPGWSESYVRARTSEVCSSISDAEELALFLQYSQVVKHKKRKKVV
jgi:hypothetical protein